MALLTTVSNEDQKKLSEFTQPIGRTRSMQMSTVGSDWRGGMT